MSRFSYVRGSIVDAYNRGEDVVHCVSSDFEMGIGVAKALSDQDPMLKINMRNTYPMNDEIHFSPFCATWHNHRFEKHIYNLVTKYRYFHKPTIATLRLSIMSLRSELERRYGADVDIFISMPKIASGADKIPWSQTEKLLKDLLPDNVTISVYELQTNPRKAQWKRNDTNKWIKK